jgi:hypothetical protein
MATKCTNCGSRLGCGCQKRTTATGKTGCVKCISKLLETEAQSKTTK